MQITKKRAIIFCIVNFILSVIAIFGSIYMMASVMAPFLEGGSMPQAHNWFFDLGSLLARYFILLTYLLPDALRYTFLGTLLSYLSAFVMTVPFTLLLFAVIRIFAKKKIKITSESSQPGAQ